MNHENVMAEVAKIPARFHFAGCDFGFETSYDAVIKVAVDDENNWLYIYDEFYKNHLTLNELAAAIKKIITANEILRCDSAEPRSIETLRRNGINATAAKKWSEGGRHARLANLRKIKSFKRIICSEACISTIKELEDLTFKTDRDGEIIADEFSIDAHTLSAIEYSLDSYHLTNPKYQLTRKTLFGY
jgi:phage terminase large subunit